MPGFKKILTLVICAVLTVALLVCITPIPHKVNATFHGYSVNADGDITDEITITAQGKYRDYLFIADEMYVDFTLSFASGATLRAKSAGPFLQLDDNINVCNLKFYAGQSQLLDGGYMAFSHDRNQIILDGVTDNSFYVACTAENADPAQLLSFFAEFFHRN